jgi:hypothetical protein
MGGFGEEIRGVLLGALHKPGALLIFGGAGGRPAPHLEFAQRLQIGAAAPTLVDQLAKS